MYAFGFNYDGELGSTTNYNTANPNPTPMLVSLPGSTGPVVQIAASRYHSLAVTSTGQLYAFGDNVYGELGSATNNPRPALVSLPGATGAVAQAAAGAYFSLAVTSTGQLYAFGNNQLGQLGRAANGNPNPTPALVSLPGASGPVVQVAAGRDFSLAVTSTGQLYAFGDNQVGQLGSASNNGTTNPNPTPALVSLPGATGAVAQVAAGNVHSLAATSTGQLYAFGDNWYGQLGSTTNNGTDNPNPTPALVSLPGATGAVAQVGAGNEHSLAATSTGQLYAFGFNWYGQLGSTTNSHTGNPNPTPMLVPLPGPTRMVWRGPGSDHSLAVVSDLSVATGSLATGTVGQAYSAQLQASGGSPPYTWSARGLPAGLSLNSSSGAISGTPTEAGEFNMQVSVTDGEGLVAARALTLPIATPAGAPSLSALIASPHKLSLAGRFVHGRCKPVTRANRHNRPCRRPLRLAVSLRVSRASTVTIAFARISAGRRVNGRCVRPTRRNRRHALCTRLSPLPGRIARTVRAGANELTITRSGVPTGKYRLIVTPSTAGHAGRAQTVTLTITA